MGLLGEKVRYISFNPNTKVVRFRMPKCGCQRVKQIQLLPNCRKESSSIRLWQLCFTTYFGKIFFWTFWDWADFGVVEIALAILLETELAIVAEIGLVFVVENTSAFLVGIVGDFAVAIAVILVLVIEAVTRLKKKSE